VAAGGHALRGEGSRSDRGNGHESPYRRRTLKKRSEEKIPKITTFVNNLANH
jgi:hypothetical protein